MNVRIFVFMPSCKKNVIQRRECSQQRNEHLFFSTEGHTMKLNLHSNVEPIRISKESGEIVVDQVNAT